MVLHAIETGGPGGAERMLVHLATGLGPDYRSEAALIRDRWLGATLRRRGVPVSMLRYTSHRFALTLRDLLKLIRTRGVAVLHTHEFFMNTLGLMASWLTGVPLVATVHGRNYYSDSARRRITYRLLGRFAGRLVTVSEANKHFLTERVGIPPSAPQGECVGQACVTGCDIGGVDDLCNLDPEFTLNVIQGYVGVFHRIMQ